MRERLDPTLFDLPEPAPEAAAHCRRVTDHIRSLIEAGGGFLSFHDYMNAALYAPGLGYYSAGTQKFGAAGDFVTAPEISPLFAGCLARQCADILERTGPGSVILEAGAGSGRLAADLLAALERLGVLPERYLILEVSGSLRERQRDVIEATVPHLAERVTWLERLPEQTLSGVILGNELLDALPVERFRIGPDGLRQIGVGQSDDTLVLIDRPAPEALESAVHALEAETGQCLPEGYESEWSPQLPALVASLAGLLETGLLLLIDYGMPLREYYLPERDRGTLMCHYRHRAHEDALLYPGLQDITAWVNFTAVAEAGVDAGLSLAGYTTQAHFLLGSGIDSVMADLATDDPRDQMMLAQQARQLALPGEMGERFKVIGLQRGLDTLPSGFGFRDLAHRL
ncbi:MAG: SAM-dependent methyltransferase [Gammaproteobacteria bacterium]|jgi:SAM-dependent MidA family methyltransferase